MHACDGARVRACRRCGARARRSRRRARTSAPRLRDISSRAGGESKGRRREGVQSGRPMTSIPTSVAKKPRVMSGMRPTGGLHLGHLVGALTQWVEFCENADAFFEIADLHAYTTEFDDPQKIRGARNDMVAVWLAAGVDPQKSTIFLQSAVPEIGELTVLLSMITPVSWLERVPTYKGQIEALGGVDCDVRFSRLSAIAAMRYRDRARRVRAGRRRSASAPGVRARSRTAIQSSLRRRASDPRRAASDAFRISRSPRHRRAQDEQVVQQRHSHFRRRGNDDEKSALDDHRSAENPARRSRAARNLSRFRPVAFRQSAAARRHRRDLPLRRARLRSRQKRICRRTQRLLTPRARTLRHATATTRRKSNASSTKAPPARAPSPQTSSPTSNKPCASPSARVMLSMCHAERRREAPQSKHGWCHAERRREAPQSKHEPVSR